MSVGRRGFLRLLAAAPVAVPVVAREAAQKAGLSADAAGSIYDQAAKNYGGPFATGSSGPDPDWCRSWAKRVFSQDWVDQTRREIGRRHPWPLDPDLAASRSLSLSAAMRIQRERNIAKEIDREQSAAREQFFRALGFHFDAGSAV